MVFVKNREPVSLFCFIYNQRQLEINSVATECAVFSDNYMPVTHSHNFTISIM